MKILILVASCLLTLSAALVNLTMDTTDSFKIVVFSDLFIDNDGSNFAYTMQMM